MRDLYNPPKAPYLVWMTPEKAVELLEGHENVRRTSQRHVDMYAAEMRDGLFTYNPDPVCLGENGKVINATHRLLAVVQSGVPMWMVVVEGLTPEELMNLDKQRRRQAALHLSRMGEINASTLASTLNILSSWEAGVPSRGNLKSDSRNSKLLDRFPGIRDSVNRWGLKKPSTELSVTRTALAATHFLLSGRFGEEKATEFFELLLNPVGQAEGSPVLALISRLRSLEGATPEKVAYAFSRCMEDWISGAPAVRLQLPTSPPPPKWTIEG